MKRMLLGLGLVFLLLLQMVSAITSSEAKADWLEAKEKRIEANTAYQEAKLEYATDPSEENNQGVIDTAKDSLNAALDEAEAWLIWKDLEAEENPEIPEDLKEMIAEDVETNLAKVGELKVDVEGIQTRLDVGIVFLKMIGKYAELLADVARDSGYIWVHLVENKADLVEEYEEKLRETAEELSDNEEILNKLDIAKSELATAENKIEAAENAYDEVKIPGMPLIKFAEGNAYLRQARTNLINAHIQLEHVYNLMVRGE